MSITETASEEDIEQTYPTSLPPQHQDTKPGIQSEMSPQPEETRPAYKGSGKLDGKVALITGGDSGIGRAVSVFFAREGADIAIAYLNEHDDAAETKRLVEVEGRRCLLFPGDLGAEANCQSVAQQTLAEFGKIDVLVNNAAEHWPQESLADITAEQLDKTFRTNVYSYFFLTKAVLPHLKEGSAIINTCSVVAFKGSPQLLDYAATKGAIVAFTRSLSQNLAEKKIRVNMVAPGPIWTPLIPSSLHPEKVAEFGKDTPMKRVGQPEELAPAYVYLASADSSYVSGQTIHVNGGEVVNG